MHQDHQVGVQPVWVQAGLGASRSGCKPVWVELPMHQDHQVGVQRDTLIHSDIERETFTKLAFRLVLVLGLVHVASRSY